MVGWLWRLLIHWLAGTPARTARSGAAQSNAGDARRSAFSHAKSTRGSDTSRAASTPHPKRANRHSLDDPASAPRPRLTPLRYAAAKGGPPNTITPTLPYQYARSAGRNGYHDLAVDGDDNYLRQSGLPLFGTPEQLAQWLGIAPGELLWLVHRGTRGVAPDNQRDHYVRRWKVKPRGGGRLIEAPKSRLKSVQRKVLHELLMRLPAHPAAHGFIAGKSIKTNAAVHVGQAILLQFDLQNFYVSVRRRRVISLFRSMGYNREVSIWLGHLLTTALPTNAVPVVTANTSAASNQQLACDPPQPSSALLTPYHTAHLPQGAPTSPALANLSAFSLDVRLSGLARAFGLHYTRYADDLTFSGAAAFGRQLQTFVPLVKAIVRDERFRLNPRKTRIHRAGARHVVTGLVVNDKLNVTRHYCDQLKATLHNCVKYGGSSQNREDHADFAAVLRGRIAHVSSVNAERGTRLLAMYRQIRW